MPQAAISDSKPAAYAAAPSLVRGLGRWELIALAVNGVVGAGIFGLPSRAFALSGSYSLLALLACAGLSALIVLCFSEVASRFGETGGPYLYARKAFGAPAGFLVGWLLWISWVAAFAANANLLLDYASFAWPALAAESVRAAVAFALVAALGWLNTRGVRGAARTGNWLMYVKLAALGAFVVAGWRAARWEQLALGPPPLPRAMVASGLLLMWAFAGFEKAVVPASEAQDPRRNLPWALGSSLVVSAVLYALIQAVAIATVPHLGATTRPLAESAAVSIGASGAAFISLVAVLSIAGNLNALMLSAARLPLAMAERGELPRILARTHARFHTPHVSIAATALAAAALTVSGAFSHAVAISSISRLLAYFATCASLIVFRARGGETARFRVPAGVAVAIASCALICVFVAASSWAEARDTAAAIALGGAAYFATRLSSARSSSPE